MLLLLRPTFGLYLLAFSVPFGSLWEVGFGGMTFGPSEVILLATLASWLLRAMAFQQMVLRARPLLWAVGVYLGAMLLSVWPASNLMATLKPLAKWIEFGLLYLFVSRELDDGGRQVLVGVLLLAGTCQGALGVYQFVQQKGPAGFALLGRYMRAHGTFSQPNPFGGYVGLLLPLAYTTCFGLWRRAWSQRRAPFLALWGIAAMATMVLLAALVMSWSRGALLGFVGGLVLVGLGLRRRAWALVLMAVLLFLLLATYLAPLLPAGLGRRLSDLAIYLGRDLTAIEITDANFSIIERLAHWQAAWRMFAARPWLGVGTGQYATAYASVALPRWQNPLGHAHNYYLHILAEGGLLGLASYLTLLAAAIAGVWRRRAGEKVWPSALALGVLGMLGHLCVHSLFDNLYVHEMYLLVAMLLGLVLYEREPDKGSVVACEAV
ncbi:MAG: O-antigen ligase family protein [Chloroflexota bacterium]|nr:O-antigen ligase family protein [Chloroflexota bacterium]